LLYSLTHAIIGSRRNVMKKFFFGIKECFAYVADDYHLYCVNKEIESLNFELDQAVGLRKQIISIELGLATEACKEILGRIKARDARHEKVATR